MVWRDLPSDLRMYLIRYAGGCHKIRLAQALARVVFEGHSAYAVASEYRVPRVTLWAKSKGLAEAIKGDARCAGHPVYESIHRAVEASRRRRLAELYGEGD